jgi:peroxiredoxin
MSELSRRAFLAGTGLVVAAKSGLVVPSLVWAAPKVGVAAPTFTASATNGKAVSLAEQRGKIVVLEWTNHDCPYVRKHYDTSNMQGLQKEASGQGVVWLTIISSAPGTQGHVSAAQADELTATRKAAPTAVLLDPTGVVGKAYGATNTPHMYVIDQALHAAERRAGRAELRPGGAAGGGRWPAGEDASHPRVRLHGQVRLRRESRGLRAGGPGRTGRPRSAPDRGRYAFRYLSNQATQRFQPSSAAALL